MRHIAIVGSGPAGYYTAEAAQKHWGEDARIDIFDRLPVPFGLIRSGVAPDHQSIKAVSKRYEKVALTDNVRFVGHVAVGEDVSIAELRGLYDAVVLATGAPGDRPMGLPGEDLADVFGSAAFVGWYNGHPHFAGLDPDLSGPSAAIVGMGNVALDVARILAKTPQELAGSDIVAHALAALERSGVRRVRVLGRRGPHQIAMTPKELGELGELARAAPLVHSADLPPAEADAALDPGLRKSVAHLRHFAALTPAERAGKPMTIEFVFFARPVALHGDEDGAVREIEIERTRLTAEGGCEGTGVTERLPADLVVSCIGYRTSPLPGVLYDQRLGRFVNQDGRIAAPAGGEGGLYCVGWARRGPTGTIGTNRPDGYALVDLIAADLAVAPAADRAGRAGFDALAAERGLDVVTFRDWKKIEQAEERAAREGAPREKFVDVAAMIRARG
ncbi:MAG: FAD-dependent oxidoreductase [Porphyrobacter sp.]|nr:FAD-dependent oxidoreductase [Porphyrobacter sp.]